MERGKLDMLFIADSHGVAGIEDIETLSHSSRVGRLEPFTVLSALAAVTDRIGLRGDLLHDVQRAFYGRAHVRFARSSERRAGGVEFRDRRQSRGRLQFWP